jgi:hypothetical protein
MGSLCGRAPDGVFFFAACTWPALQVELHCAGMVRLVGGLTLVCGKLEVMCGVPVLSFLEAWAYHIFVPEARGEGV